MNNNNMDIAQLLLALSYFEKAEILLKDLIDKKTSPLSDNKEPW